MRSRSTTSTSAPVLAIALFVAAGVTLTAQHDGLVPYVGGPVLGTRALTQREASSIPEGGIGDGWQNVPNAVLSWVIPAGAPSDLVTLTFSAECGLFNNGGVDDFVRIRILHIKNGTAAPIQPSDGVQAFCHANGYATHQGTWMKRVGAGDNLFRVQVWIFDGFEPGGPPEPLVARLDDWTFQLVAYD